MGGRSHTQLGLGSGRSGSSRRGKKNNLEKPKQPQRGLGVAQLEKILLQNQMMAASYPSPFDCDLHKDIGRVQMAHPSSPSSSSITTSSSSLFDLHHNIMIGFGDTAGMDIKNGACHSSATARCNHYSSLHQAVVPTATLPLLEQSMETNRYQDDWYNSIDSISQNSCDLQELDLELRL